MLTKLVPVHDADLPTGHLQVNDIRQVFTVVVESRIVVTTDRDNPCGYGQERVEYRLTANVAGMQNHVIALQLVQNSLGNLTMGI